MTTTAGAHMRGTDAFAWHMEREDPVLRSTVVAVMWLDRAPRWEDFVERIDRMSRRMPSLRQRIVESPLGITSPRWTFDPHFDLHWHVRRVEAPRPHTKEAVLELARLSAMDAFDRDRPLWEFTLVEGIRDSDARAAAVMKVHHSLSDGVGGMRGMDVLFDRERNRTHPGEMPPAPAGETLSRRALVADAVGTLAGFTTHLARRGAVAAVPSLARWARHPMASAREAVAMGGSVYRFAAPILDTMSPVMRERATTRDLAMMQVGVDELRRAAKAVDGTVNDAYLGAVTGGLRRYHERHGAAVDSLRVTLPINLRAEQDVAWGNRITLERLTLPVGEKDPATRMRLLHEVIEAARNEPSLPVTDTLAGALNMLPASYVGGMLKHVDFLASNLPGSPVPIYLAGGRVTGFFAFGPTIGSAFNITLISYGSSCDIGINIDTVAVPDPEVLLACLREGFDEVLALGGPER